MAQVTELLSIFIVFLLIQLPLLIVINLLIKNKLLNNIRIIAITSYIVVIISLTLWSTIPAHPPVSWSEIPYNLKPFDSIIGSLNHSYFMVGIRNILGNFVLLLPLAMLLKGASRIMCK